MTVARVGVVPTMTDPAAADYHRASLVLSRESYDSNRYGRAPAGDLTQNANVHRLPSVAGCVVWGKDDAAVAQLVRRNRCALMLVVVPKKPSADLQAALDDAASKGSDVHVVPFTASKKATGYDLGSGGAFSEVADPTRPPQQQHVPSIPRAAVPARVHSAPAVPRDAAAAAAPTGAPAMPKRREVKTPGAPPAMPARPATAAAPTDAPAMPKRRTVKAPGNAPALPSRPEPDPVGGGAPAVPRSLAELMAPHRAPRIPRLGGGNSAGMVRAPDAPLPPAVPADLGADPAPTPAPAPPADPAPADPAPPADPPE